MEKCQSTPIFSAKMILSFWTSLVGRQQQQRQLPHRQQQPGRRQKQQQQRQQHFQFIDHI